MSSKKPAKNNLKKSTSRRQPNKQTTSEKAIERKEKLEIAIKLRKASISYDEINQTLENYFGSAKGTQAAVSRALGEVVLESAKDLKKIQAGQVEKVLSQILKKAESGNLLAVDRVLKLWKRQAELFGLDSPIKIAETDPSGEKSAEKPKVVFYLPPNGRESNAPSMTLKKPENPS